MGASVRVKGVRDPDGKLGSMILLKEQCDKVGASYPVEMVQYFAGVDELEFATKEELILKCCEHDVVYEMKIEGLVEGNPDEGDGMIIDLSKLPADIKKLRVYMSH